MTTLEKDMRIYHGIRGDKFKTLIRDVLSLGGLTEPYVSVLLDNEENFRLYEQVFTHKTADPVFNYECMEFLGDVTLNKSIAWYLARRFPQLTCASGVKILTRLKINLVSKKSFAIFAKTLKFWNFVSADMETRTLKMDKTLEDVFEAFFGATEMLLDNNVQIHCGYNTCYRIVEKLLNDTNISLKYDHLFDAKTRLKELFDQYKDTLGAVKYTSVRDKDDGKHHVTIHRIFPVQNTNNNVNKDVVIRNLMTDINNARQSRRQIPMQTIYNTLTSIQKNPKMNENGKPICSASGHLKATAEQRAAEEALTILEKEGFKRLLPPDYEFFCT